MCKKTWHSRSSQVDLTGGSIVQRPFLCLLYIYIVTIPSQEAFLQFMHVYVQHVYYGYFHASRLLKTPYKQSRVHGTQVLKMYKAYRMPDHRLIIDNALCRISKQNAWQPLHTVLKQIRISKQNAWQPLHTVLKQIQPKAYYVSYQD